MKLVFLSMNYPPEVNALATRTYRHATHWAENGDVEIITDVPHFPEGEVYDGYRNKHTVEQLEGVSVRRVPMYIAPNEGAIRRSMSFASFMLSSLAFGFWHLEDADVVGASSPQLLTAVAGYVLSRLKSAPFVLEIRDLWPESIVAGGGMNRNGLIRLLEVVETFLYRHSDHIVAVSERIKDQVVEKGASPRNVSVVMNGVDLEFYSAPPDEAVARARTELGLDGKFVVSYLGTTGLAHRADVLLEAAERCTEEDIVFMVVGTGAQRKSLEEKTTRASADNFRLVDKQPKARVPLFLALSDVSVVHLKDDPVFETAIPSKLFEAMAMGNPVIHGVRGESREIVERAGVGIPVEPEAPDEIVAAALRLKRDRGLYHEMSRNGPAYIRKHHDRRALAGRYWEILRSVANQ